MLRVLGFPPQFITWVQGCITGTWYSLKINDGLSGFFQGKSGIRQEDPLSPSLFVLSMEILSRGDVPYVMAVKDTLADFAKISGLEANIDKTNIYFRGVSQAFKYIFDPLITKVQQSIQHWSSNLLSYAGKAYILKHENIWSILPKTYFSSSFKGMLAARDYLIAKTGSIQAAQQLLTSCSSAQHLQTSKLYGYLLDVLLQEDWYIGLLHPKIVPSHKIITSLAVHNRLDTVDNLQARGFHLANRYVLFKQAQEDHQRLFCCCSFSQAVWGGLLHWINQSHQPHDLISELKWIHQQGRFHHWRIIWLKVILSAVVSTL
ncbi:uncharacterized protein LOC141656980 [Silene latifolia]|uniref:uncharacterized protein LOC141656980 n=1 Tax=Silene latifolia TaxID=37657 RepID=UPI003D771B36